MPKLIIYSVCICLLLAIARPLSAQTPGVKKSTKTELIEGKKFYLHTVDKGQTLFAIAKAYDLTVNDILVENPDAINGIRPGQILRIPAQKTTTPAASKTTPVKGESVLSREADWILYTVEAGQTLYSIAQKNNTTVERLNQLNPELKTTSLRAGQQIKIPGKAPLSIDKSKPQEPQSKSAATPLPLTPETEFQENKKTMYTIALMLPLQLGTVESIDPAKAESGETPFPAKAEAAVEFYEGALLAVDSMRKRGMRIKLYVYDIGEADSLAVEKTLAKPEFENMDLILGPLDPGPFNRVAEFGQRKNIAVVSPLSPANRVLFKHPQASKVVPAIATQMEQLASYLGKKDYQHIILINSGSAKEQHAVSVFQNSMNGFRRTDGKDSIRTSSGSAAIQSLLRKDQTNVLVVPSNSQAFVTSLLLTLNGLADQYDIVVYGLSSWMNYDNLDAEYMQRLKLHFIAPYFIDYDQTATKQFLLKYRTTFKGDASPYAFAGYDVAYYFLDALHQYGTYFYRKQNTLLGNGLQQKFEFYRPEGESGYENRGVRIVRIEDYKLVREQ